MRLILALDAGTTGVRTVAFNEVLEPVFDSYRELHQSYPFPGEVEHDPQEIVDLAIATLSDVARSAKENGHEILALGITNQRETTIAFDRVTGRILHPAIVWQDRRTSTRCLELERAGKGELVRQKTGLVLDAYFSATKMQWLLAHDVMNDAEAPSLATVDTWLLWNLTGGAPNGTFVTEPSNASRTMLFDIASDTFTPDMLGPHVAAMDPPGDESSLDGGIANFRAMFPTWSLEMMDLFGVPHTMLPNVSPSASFFGYVSPDLIPELREVPITGVLGDQQAALFGQACFEPGLIKATYGTGAFLLANAGATLPNVVPGLLTSIAWNLGDNGPRNYVLEGSAFVAGAAVQWLRDLGIIEASSELEALALSVENSAGVNFVPAFTGLGSPFWQPDVRGALTGLSRGVGKGEIARALVEALAYQVRAMTDAFVEGGLTIKELRADGGAAALNLLLQLQATNSRVNVLRCASLEATARGAASIAGLEVGLWSSLEELSSLWHHDETFTPEDPLFVDIGYADWRRALERL